MFGLARSSTVKKLRQDILDLQWDVRRWRELYETRVVEPVKETPVDGWCPGSGVQTDSPYCDRCERTDLTLRNGTLPRHKVMPRKLEREAANATA